MPIANIKTPKVEKEVIMDNEYAEAIYNSAKKLAQVTWKETRIVPSEEYKKIFWAVLDFVEDKDFHYFISDSRKEGIESPDDRKWFQNTIVPEAAKKGLKKGAIIIKKDPFKKYYMNAILSFINRNAPYSVKIFYDYDECMKFILDK